MLYQRLEEARKFVGVIFTVGPVVLVVVLEHAGPAAHTFRPTVDADASESLSSLG
jgi:hypothetical protein